MTESSTNTNQDMFETPGQLLRMQREKMGLSAEDIAKRVHLDIKIIEAIEADSEDDLPSAIYVRGYLRSYAKTVDADADKLIELYNNETPPALPELLPEVKPPTQASSNDKPVKAFTYLLTLGLVLLLLIWYQSNYVVEVNTTKEEESNSNNEAEINNVDINYEVITHDNTSWQSPDVAEGEINLDNEAEPPAILETDEENGLLKLQSFNEEQTIEISTIEDLELGSNEEAVTETVVVSSGDAIVMQISHDSWIEIMDKDNNKVFFDLAKAGETYTLNGSAPFEILFGYAAGVSLTLNGETVDFKSHIKNGIARFTLPE
jgi:cytoskeleton protein RodZ